MEGQRVSHYQIFEKIGGGGMGVVYKAQDIRLQRRVAVKFLPEKYFGNQRALERFEREARAASALNHPNICTVYAIDEHEGQPFIAMEFLVGTTLKYRIKNDPIDLEGWLDIGVQLAGGLQAAHSRGIIHRDIKPSNIFLTTDGLAKIVDFGLAKIVAVPEDGRDLLSQPTAEMPEESLTRPGAVVGTIAYMSPEQALGNELDARSDLFSLGVVLYEVLTGSHPFGGRTQAAFYDALIHSDPDPASSLDSSIPPGIEPILSKLLQKDPKERFQSAGELRLALTSLQNQLGDVRPIRGTWYRLLRPIVFVLMVFVLALLLGIVDWTRFKDWTWFGPRHQDIAVLLFENVGNNPRSQSLLAGLTYELTGSLTKMGQVQENLRVVPAAEILASDVFTASRAKKFFGVNLAVSGSLEIIGQELRMTLHLINAETLRQMDFELIVNPEGDFTKLKEAALQTLVSMLELNLEPDTFQVLASSGTTVASAYRHYLSGMGLLERPDQVGNVEEAIQEFRIAIQEDPNFASAQAALSTALRIQFKETDNPEWIELAEEACEQALLLNDQLPAAYISCGSVYLERGLTEEALEQYQIAVRLDPNSSTAYRGLARVEAELGNFGEAESTLLEAIHLKPDYWVGYAHLGYFYIDQGRYEEAVGPLEQALNFVPNNYRIYNNIGSARILRQREAEAIQAFQLSIAIEPNYGAYSNLGAVYYFQGDFAKAAEMYELALQHRDSDYRVWDNLAGACRKTPERASEAPQFYARAIEMAEELLQVNPRKLDVILHLADFYLVLEKYEQVGALLEQALELFVGNPDLMVRLGKSSERLGRREEAIEWILKALQNGFPLSRIETSSTLDELRTDERFQRGLEEIDQRSEP